MYQTCMVWNTGNSTPLLLIVRGVTVLELQYTAWCISEGSYSCYLSWINSFHQCSLCTDDIYRSNIIPRSRHQYHSVHIQHMYRSSRHPIWSIGNCKCLSNILEGLQEQASLYCIIYLCTWPQELCIKGGS